MTESFVNIGTVGREDMGIEYSIDLRNGSEELSHITLRLQRFVREVGGSVIFVAVDIVWIPSGLS